MKVLTTPCDCCYADGARLVVFDSVALCEACRMAVVYWFRDSELGMAVHPFLDEFCRFDRAKFLHWLS